MEHFAGNIRWVNEVQQSALSKPPLKPWGGHVTRYDIKCVLPASWNPKVLTYMGPRTPDYDEPACDICGSDMLWEDCWNCGGQGGRDGEELMEEDPLWYDEDDWEDCDICEGAGGWYVCLNNKNHPVAKLETDAESSAVPDAGDAAAPGAGEEGK